LQQVSGILEHDRAAEAAARDLGDERRLGRVSSGLANTLFITGDLAAAMAAASRAMHIGHRLGDAVTHATAVLRLGAIHYTTGEYERAVAYLRQAVELTGGERLRELLGMAGIASVLARHWLARALADLGDLSEALAVAREGLAINLSTDSVAGLPAAYSAIGYVHLQRGDLAETLAPLTRAVEVGQAAEVLNWGTISLGLLGLRDARAGRPSEGVSLEDRLTQGPCGDAALGGFLDPEHHFRFGWTR